MFKMFVSIQDQQNVHKACHSFVRALSIIQVWETGLSPIKAIGRQSFTEGTWREALLYDLKTLCVCCVLDHKPGLDNKVEIFL